MWKYIRPYLPFALLAALFMGGEVLMDLLQPDIMQRIVDDGVLGVNNGGTGDMSIIIRFGVLMICLVICGGLSGSLNNVFTNLASQNIGNNMRKDAFTNIMSFSFPQVDKFSTGSLITRVTNDITQVQSLVSQVIRGMIRTVLLTIGSFIFMFRLSPGYGLIVLCAFPFMVGCMALCLWKALPLFPLLQTQLDRINEIMQEDISGIRIIKACVRESYEKLRFGKANDDLIRTQLRTLLIFAFMNPFMNLLMNAVIVLVLVAGAHSVGAGTSTPGAIMAAITYTTTLLHGILMLLMLFQSITRGAVSWKRVKEVLDTRPEIVGGSFTGEPPEHGTVELRHVSFAYPGGSQTVLHDVNLRIGSGQTVAIMGATGCGKTTLVNLIPRFYDVTEGEVLLDGVNVKEYPLSVLRERVTAVLQRAELFSQTITENIRWGGSGDVETAARIAQADDFIRETPEGYETVVAERGMSLSGGQKQRVSIARAVIRDSEILILDDSTSALDLKTEAAFYDALDREKPGCTKIIVAQRIASVRRADQIVVLENGTVSACGTHEELMAHCAAYQDIYHSQLGEEAMQNGSSK